VMTTSFSWERTSA